MSTAQARAVIATAAAVLALAACTSGGPALPRPLRDSSSAAMKHGPSVVRTRPATASTPAPPNGLPGMPAPLDSGNVYAADGPNMLRPAVAHDPAYVYVPNHQATRCR